MSKIICDICGTSYQDSAECCPICGCTRDAAADLLEEEIAAEEAVETLGKAATIPSKKKEIFDYDEVNSERKKEVEDEDEDDEDEDYDEEDEGDDEPRHNTFVVILLTILIVGLLLAAGFIFAKYFLPNMGDKDTAENTTAVPLIESTEVTEATIPCEYIVMNNESKAELVEEGQMFLLNVLVKPENTTDKIIYTSGNESIATVSEDGKITAVSEGETTIYISCGKYSMECPVIVKYVEETVPATTEAEAGEETVAETVAETTAATEADSSIDPNVVLKLKKTDIMLGVYYQYTLELDCGLEQNQVEWSSEHPHIATVDENGVVTAVKSGTTAIIAKYGDQQVQCIVRCS